MLTVNYKSHHSKNLILLTDRETEQYLLASIKLSKTINISQISIIYVLRKLIAQNKINHSDVIVHIDGTHYTINSSGRFDTYPPITDLFDDCLDAILKGK